MFSKPRLDMGKFSRNLITEKSSPLVLSFYAERFHAKKNPVVIVYYTVNGREDVLSSHLPPFY